MNDITKFIITWSLLLIYMEFVLIAPFIFMAYVTSRIK